MKKAQFITTFRYVDFVGSIENFQLMPGINITNNESFKKSLLTPNLLENIGKIEYDFLAQASNIVYFDYDHKDLATLKADNPEALLLVILVWIDELFRDAWLIKDHSMECDSAFLFATHESGETQWYSNYLAYRPSLSNGEHKVIKMTIDEVTEWAKINAHFTNYLFEKDSPSMQFMMTKGFKRTGRAIKFVSSARTSPNLAFKIAHYCSALETLFATDTSELSHKLSERTAFFLGNLGYNRHEVFKNIKRAYDVRSKLTHGDILTDNRIKELPEISEIVDDYLRKIFLAILSDNNFQSIFDSDNQKLNGQKIDEYFYQMIFSDSQKPG